MIVERAANDGGMFAFRSCPPRPIGTIRQTLMLVQPGSYVSRDIADLEAVVHTSDQ